MFRFVKITCRMREGDPEKTSYELNINFSTWTSNSKHLLHLFPILLVSLCSVLFVFLVEVVMGHLWRCEVLNVTWNAIWHHTSAVTSFLELRLVQSTGFTNVYWMSTTLMNIFIRQDVQFLPYKIYLHAQFCRCYMWVLTKNDVDESRWFWYHSAEVTSSRSRATWTSTTFVLCQCLWIVSELSSSLASPLFFVFRLDKPYSYLLSVPWKCSNTCPKAQNLDFPLILNLLFPQSSPTQ